MDDPERPDRDPDDEAGPGDEHDEETAEFASGPRPPAPGPDASREELAEQARRLCAELVEFFPLGRVPKVTARCDEESIYVNVEGDGSGLLIGKKGQTLDALQYLLSRMVNKDRRPSVRIELDTENYRTRRRGQLTALARKAADEVRASGQEQALEPMSPTERRIIHLALRDMPDVLTESEGDPPDRYVVVRPRSPEDAADNRDDGADD